MSVKNSLIAGFVRFGRFGLIVPTVLLLLSQLAACATKSSPMLLPESSGASFAVESPRVASNPTSAMADDEKSRRVAADLVAALSQVISDQLPVSEFSAYELNIVRPENSFEYQLLEQLQLAGFSVLVAEHDMQGALSYRVELVSSYAGEQSGTTRNNMLPVATAAASFNDYNFRLLFNNFELLRQYRVSEQTVYPLTKLVMTDHESQTRKVIETDNSIFADALP